MLTFQTNIWEKDWRLILNDGYLEEIINRCNTTFTHKEIIVNNVVDKSLIKEKLQTKVNETIIDNFYFVEDYIDMVLNYFSITKDSFKGAYYVSSSELVGMYLCKTDFLLYFKGDAHLYKNNNKWINQGVELLQKHKDILVVNPIWNGKIEEVKNESFAEMDNFFIGYGFSDQCFLVRSNDFKNRIYNEVHSSSKRYPWGNSFETRVNSYMRNHELKRATHKKDNYLHKNFKLRSSFLQKINFIRRNYILQRLKKH